MNTRRGFLLTLLGACLWRPRPTQPTTQHPGNFRRFAPGTVVSVSKDKKHVPWVEQFGQPV